MQRTLLFIYNFNNFHNRIFNASETEKLHKEIEKKKVMLFSFFAIAESIGENLFKLINSLYRYLLILAIGILYKQRPQKKNAFINRF